LKAEENQRKLQIEEKQKKILAIFDCKNFVWMENILQINSNSRKMLFSCVDASHNPS
jgi:hypothetical protein